MPRCRHFCFRDRFVICVGADAHIGPCGHERFCVLNSRRDVGIAPYAKFWIGRNNYHLCVGRAALSPPRWHSHSRTPLRNIRRADAHIRPCRHFGFAAIHAEPRAVARRPPQSRLRRASSPEGEPRGGSGAEGGGVCGRARAMEERKIGTKKYRVRLGEPDPVGLGIIRRGRRGS